MLEIINGLLSSAILTISVYFFGVFILKDKNKPQKSLLYKLIVILISIIIHTLIFVYLTGTVKTILLCILFAITFKLIFETNYSKSLIASIIYIIILIVPDLITLGIVTKIFNISKEYCHTHLAGSVISNISVTTITIVMSYILKKPLRKLLEYNFSTSKKIIFVSLFTLIAILIFFYNLINTFRLNNDIYSNVIVITTLIIIQV